VQLGVGSLERRRLGRGAPRFEPTRSDLVPLIVGMYREMPGLILRLNQAARLFGLSETTCRVVMEDLVRQGVLRLSSDDQYIAARSEQ